MLAEDFRYTRGFAVTASIQGVAVANSNEQSKMALLVQCVNTLDARLNALSETALVLQRRHASDMAGMCQQLQQHSQSLQRAMAQQLHTVQQQANGTGARKKNEMLLNSSLSKTGSWLERVRGSRSQTADIARSSSSG